MKDDRGDNKADIALVRVTMFSELPVPRIWSLLVASRSRATLAQLATGECNTALPPAFRKWHRHMAPAYGTGMSHRHVAPAYRTGISHICSHFYSRHFPQYKPHLDLPCTTRCSEWRKFHQERSSGKTKAQLLFHHQVSQSSACGA